MAPSPRIHLAPAGRRAWLADAIRAGGGEIVDLPEAEGLVWASAGDPEALTAALAAGPQLRWIQLPWAGVDKVAGVLDDAHTWTSGKGVYAEPVAEMALTLALAGLRGFGTYARATSWSGPEGANLLGAEVCVVGAGGIARSLLRLLAPFGCRVTVVRRHAEPVEGADRVVALDDLDDALVSARVVFLAVALTPETTGLFDARRFGHMRTDAWLVNVARGGHVVTDDLVAALSAGAIGGAGLDVTDPEPLPEGHPLWSMPNVLITPHVGNTPEMAVPLLSRRVTENVRRFGAGEPLVGLVDPTAGY